VRSSVDELSVVLYSLYIPEAFKTATKEILCRFRDLSQRITERSDGIYRKKQSAFAEL